MAEMIDPLYDEQSEAISELFNIFAILMLLSINGHHFFLKVLFESFYFIPLTTFNFPNQILPRFIEVLQQIFIIGIKLAAPMMIILLLVKTMIGLLNRMVQEADVFSIILVLDLLLGFYILQFYWPYFATMVNQQFFIYKKEVLEFVKLLGST
jgi:flagellar biosynthetic protein FliR